MMKKFVFVVATFAVLILNVTFGAPTYSDDDAIINLNEDDDLITRVFRQMCLDMYPRHDGSPPQTSEFPIRIELPQTLVVRPGQTIPVTLRSQIPFRGLFAQARALDSVIPVGSWSSDDDLAITIGCIDLINPPEFPGFDTVGQDAASTLRLSQKLTWTAPQEAGIYRIYLTTVESFGRFWINQTSYPIVVTV